MRSPHEQILDLVVKMDARDARKVRDMADAHLRDLEEAPHTEGLDPECAVCTITRARHSPLSPFRLDGAELQPDSLFANDQGAELQRGLEAAVISERERLDGPDDDSD